MLKIRTNNVPRFTLDAYELSAAERAEFDYLNWPAIEAGNDSATFFKYKGHIYDLGEFMLCTPSSSMEGWDAYLTGSAFSGILIKCIANDTDSVIVGQYFS